MTERRAQSVRKGAEWSRGVAWFGMLILVCAAAGWALLWVDCALTGRGWARPEGLKLLYALAVGLVPLVLVLGAVVALWTTQGPPFSRPGGEAQRKASNRHPSVVPRSDKGGSR